MFSTENVASKLDLESPTLVYLSRLSVIQSCLTFFNLIEQGMVVHFR